MKEYISSREGFGWRMILLAFVFGFLETWYFGWHAFPKSEKEFIADIICLSSFYYGLGALTSAYSLKRFINKNYESQD